MLREAKIHQLIHSTDNIYIKVNLMWVYNTPAKFYQHRMLHFTGWIISVVVYLTIDLMWCHNSPAEFTQHVSSKDNFMCGYISPAEFSRKMPNLKINLEWVDNSIVIKTCQEFNSFHRNNLALFNTSVSK